MADRGFDKSKDLAFRGTTLCIPPFTKGKSQLSQWEVEMSSIIYLHTFYVTVAGAPREIRGPGA